MGKGKKKDKIERAVEFITPFIDDMEEWINRAIAANSESIRLFLSAMVNVCLGSGEEITKYELVYGNCRWDQSGELKSIGNVDITEPLNFFFKEYSGRWEPTYVPGCGKNWKSILDECETYQISEYFIQLAIWSILNKNDYNVQEQREIEESVHDTLYDDSEAEEFFLAEGAIAKYYDENGPAKQLFDAGAMYADRLSKEYEKHHEFGFSLWDAWVLVSPKYPEIALTAPELPQHIEHAKRAFQEGKATPTETT